MGEWLRKKEKEEENRKKRTKKKKYIHIIKGRNFFSPFIAFSLWSINSKVNNLSVKTEQARVLEHTCSSKKEFKEVPLKVSERRIFGKIIPYQTKDSEDLEVYFLYIYFYLFSRWENKICKYYFRLYRSSFGWEVNTYM